MYIVWRFNLKQCNRCKDNLPLIDFSNHSGHKDGKASICKPCDNKASKIWRITNKTAIKNRRDSNKDYLNKVAREKYQATKHLIDKDIIRLRKRKYYLKNKEYVKRKSAEWAKANRDKRAFYNANRRALQLQRTPKWLKEEDFSVIRAYYRVAKKLTEVTSELHHVDHIIPLQGEFVSGFHCPSNLQVLKATDNCSKSNTFLPH